METLTRICLIGPECTGKSTLAEELAGKWGTVWVPEFAREYALRVKRALTAEDVDAIAEGQLAFEERAAPLALKLLILDTDLISTVVYSQFYYGKVPAWVARAAAARVADLYLLFDIDVPWEGDGARDATPAARPALHDAFVRTLAEYGARVVRVGGDWETRREMAVRAVGELVGR
ncbi:MAG: ATP-binding protein [Acidobacteria bacterium]|nr:ATP-binding protein [Acidobacteriota bacterium]